MHGGGSSRANEGLVVGFSSSSSLLLLLVSDISIVLPCNHQHFLARVMGGLDSAYHHRVPGSLSLNNTSL